mmetsp:Transcript_1615/g.3696  ORF Transcript_1615/g.3696 Transcript_1615/m.3696 type:complete len:204 (+) Transcript_1615:1474-2085(+)
MTVAPLESVSSGLFASSFAPLLSPNGTACQTDVPLKLEVGNAIVSHAHPLRRRVSTSSLGNIVPVFTTNNSSPGGGPIGGGTSGGGGLLIKASSTSANVKAALDWHAGRTLSGKSDVEDAELCRGCNKRRDINEGPALRGVAVCSEVQLRCAHVPAPSFVIAVLASRSTFLVYLGCSSTLPLPSLMSPLQPLWRSTKAEDARK